MVQHIVPYIAINELLHLHTHTTVMVASRTVKKCRVYNHIKCGTPNV